MRYAWLLVVVGLATTFAKVLTEQELLIVLNEPIEKLVQTWKRRRVFHLFQLVVVGWILSQVILGDLLPDLGVLRMLFLNINTLLDAL